MNDNEKALKKLYKDAMYCHLLREGCKSNQARLKIGMVFDN